MKYTLKILLPLTIIVLVLLFFSREKILHTLTPSNDNYQYLGLVAEVSSKIEKDYVDTVDPAKKFPKAFSAMLRSLDKLSSYLDNRKTILYKTFKGGKFYSCGVYGSIKRGYFHISGIKKGSPAETSGIEPGDIIKAIEGESIFSLSFWEVYLSLISKAPETKELVVFKKGSGIPQKIVVKSSITSLKPEVANLKEKICHIKVRNINKEAVEIIGKAMKAGKKMVLDLRNYEGGDFRSLLNLASLFNIKSQLSIKYKNRTENFNLSSGIIPFKLKAVVIIDESTIMESQLLGILLKKEGATIVGRKTEGFCNPLRKIDFIDDTSILLTNGLYLIDQEDISKKGLEPDVHVKLQQEITTKALELIKENNGGKKKE